MLERRPLRFAVIIDDEDASDIGSEDDKRTAFLHPLTGVRGEAKADEGAQGSDVDKNWAVSAVSVHIQAVDEKDYQLTQATEDSSQ